MLTHQQLLASWQEDFRGVYQADHRNSTRQSFDEYWTWIEVFFLTGGSGQPGWFVQTDQFLSHVRDEAVRDRLRQRMYLLGRHIGGEWAKASRYRRIFSTFLQGSPNLMEWSRRLERASLADTNYGMEIEQALATIETEVHSMLQR